MTTRLWLFVSVGVLFAVGCADVPLDEEEPGAEDRGLAPGRAVDATLGTDALNPFESPDAAPRRDDTGFTSPPALDSGWDPLDAAIADAAIPDAKLPDPPDSGPPPSSTPPLAYPELPRYSHGACPPLQGGSDRNSSVVEGFRTGEQTRAFRLMIPPDYDGTRPLPLIFAWHWLNATSGSFVREAELETAVEQMQFIAVLPDALRNRNGDRTYLLSWPFAEVWGIPAEETFFDDLLACVTEQFNVDLQRVYGIGVSAGALWLTYLSTTARANYFSAVEVLSGGLGDMVGVWRMEYQPQARRFPAIVLWGGPADWLALSFHDASIRLRDAFVAHDHFVVECTHDAGHGVPPVEPPPGDTKFRFLWRFMFDHPYDLGAGESPYRQTGLSDVFPDWCRIASP